MLIFIDARAPDPVKKTLNAYGQVVDFSTHGITYDTISGHPDIFICQTPAGIVIAPNLPSDYQHMIIKNCSRVYTGSEPVRSAWPKSALYNAFVNSYYCIHNQHYTSQTISAHCKELTNIHVNQAYTKCNLVEAGGLYITSDLGIERTLNKAGLDTCYIDPRQILLPGQIHGFFGGCTGYWNHQLFLTGSCKHFKEGETLRNALQERKIHLVELYDGPLYDGGSILFL